MDDTFRDFLVSGGIKEETVAYLEEELIISKETFTFLKEEHFQKLLPKMKVGQHARLLMVWEDCQDEYFSDERVKRPLDTWRCSSFSDKSLGRSRSSSPTSESISSGSTPSQSYGPQKLLSSSKDIKELARLYKASAVSKFNKGCEPKLNKRGDSIEDSKNMMILLGGMIFDRKQNKGVRRKYLPEPNPARVMLSKDSDITTVLQKAIDYFYKDFSPISTTDILLADSSGNKIEISNPKEWKLGDYYPRNGFKPSRHKFYTMLLSSKMNVEQDNDVEQEQQLQDEIPKSSMECTEAIIALCIECGRKYRTYVPDSICSLPNGGLVSYKEPQLKCPMCDEGGYGDFMNFDLFPELASN